MSGWKVERDQWREWMDAEPSTSRQDACDALDRRIAAQLDGSPTQKRPTTDSQAFDNMATTVRPAPRFDIGSPTVAETEPPDDEYLEGLFIPALTRSLDSAPREHDAHPKTETVPASEPEAFELEARPVGDVEAPELEARPVGELEGPAVELDRPTGDDVEEPAIVQTIRSPISEVRARAWTPSGTVANVDNTYERIDRTVVVPIEQVYPLRSGAAGESVDPLRSGVADEPVDGLQSQERSKGRRVEDTDDGTPQFIGVAADRYIGDPGASAPPPAPAPKWDASSVAHETSAEHVELDAEPKPHHVKPDHASEMGPEGPHPSAEPIADAAEFRRQLDEELANPRGARPWFEDVFGEHYAALTRQNHGLQAKAEVEFFVQVGNLLATSRVVDIGCGDGAHSIALSQRGFDVTGLDLSLAQLLRAAKANEALGTSVRFIHGDMRRPPIAGPFDAALCLGTTLGYFDDEDNRSMFETMRDLLVPGGRLLIQVMNRDYLVSRLPARSWWQAKNCLVLDEVEMNFFTNRMVIHRTMAFENGRQFVHDMPIRLFSAHDLGRMCVDAGFRVVEISGSRHARGRFYGATSPEIWLVVERV